MSPRFVDCTDRTVSVVSTRSLSICSFRNRVGGDSVGFDDFVSTCSDCD